VLNFRTLLLNQCVLLTFQCFGNLPFLLLGKFFESLDLIALLANIYSAEDIFDLIVVLLTQSLNLSLFLCFDLICDLLLLRFELLFDLPFVLRLLDTMASGESLLQSTIKLLLLTFLFVFKDTVDV
jgi:hypothetical protein